MMSNAFGMQNCRGRMCKAYGMGMHRVGKHESGRERIELGRYVQRRCLNHASAVVNKAECREVKLVGVGGWMKLKMHWVPLRLGRDIYQHLLS